MADDTDRHGLLTRRRLLEGAGAGLALGAFTDVGAASAQDDDSGSGTGLHNVGIRPGHEGPGIRAARQAADSVRKTIDLGPQGSVVNGRFPAEARDALEKRPHVEFVEEDVRYHTTAQTLPWGIDRIDAERIHGADTVGDPGDVTVAVIDTGIDSDHPDLPTPVAGKAFGTTCGGRRGENCDAANGNVCHENWDDDFDHGTHVAGTVAAEDNTEDVVGVLPGVDLIAAKVIDGCDNARASDLADAIQWVTNQGADVVNMSLGGLASGAVENACLYAHRLDVTLVASAGNSGNCTPADCVGYPARYSTVIAVSNITDSDGLRSDSQNGPEIEFGAPGNGVLSTVPPESVSDGTAFKGGTSMASPHVAGTAAAVKDMTTLSDELDIRSRLHRSAENIEHSPSDQGYGMVDALAATNVDGVSPDDPQLTPYHRTIELTDEWDRVFFPPEYTDPVVVAGPATLNGSHPTTVRVRDVQSNSMEISLHEWEYLNGTHVPEDVTVAVFERAEFVELDGAAAETGHVTGVDENWESVSFADVFDSTPVVVTQCVTFDGSDPVTTRVRNVDTTGFEVRLQEEEANGGHVDEQVDYLAVEPSNTQDVEAATTGDVVDHTGTSVSLSFFDNRPDLLTQIQTFDGPDTCNVRVSDWDAGGFDVLVDEEQSVDSETWHTSENVGYVALEQFENEPLLYETGTGTTNQPDRDTWHRVRASGFFDDPVVVMGPITDNGRHPVHPRVRNVGTTPSGLTSFDFQLEEWAYLNGPHNAETLSYGVFERGPGTIGSSRVEAGYTYHVDHEFWETVYFTEHFDRTPVVLTQCTSQTGDDPVTVRTRNVDTRKFQIKVQEEEANGPHVTERVDYLAIEPGDSGEVEVATTGNTVTDTPQIFDPAYDGFGEPPDLLMSMQTTDGGNTANLRVSAWDESGFGVFVEEETSADGETAHTSENVGYAAFEHDDPTGQLTREVGTASNSQPDASTWHRVNTTRGFTDPVAVMGPPTFDGGQPVTVRVRDVGVGGFEYQLDEWDYLNDEHVTEGVGYGVFEAGVGTIDAGNTAVAEAGAVGTDENWLEVPFDLTAEFGATPVVVAQCASRKGADPVVTRVRNVTTDGFEVRLQEEEAKNDPAVHTRERIDYLAVEPVDTATLEVGTTGDVVNHNETRVNLSGFSSTPHVLAHIQTFHGSDPCNLRISNVDASGFDVEVDEENSVDGEGHVTENVGYVAFE